MEGILLHPRSHAELAALQKDPPHALLLVAPHGTGKRFIAHSWARGLTDAITVLEPDEKGTITIDATRALYQRTRAKQSNWQIVIVDHAETMSLEAQNAFLKLLEEPRAGLTFVLTAPDATALLPTITSRVQMVHILPMSQAQLAAYARVLQPSLDGQALQQVLFMARGRPATLVALTHKNGEVFESHKTIMGLAKQLLGSPIYERLAAVPDLSKDRARAVATLEAMTHMLGLQLRRGTAPQLLRLAEALQLCLARLAQNGNLRAQLTHLFLSY